MFIKKANILILSFFIGSSASAQCIGVVTSGVGAFWNEVIAGAQQAAKEIGIRLYARGAVLDDDEKSQHYIIRQAIYGEQCQGLLLAPNSNARLEEVELLKQRGIFTVYVDRDIGGARVSVVQTNNTRAGMRAGRAMLKALNRRKGNIAVLGFKKGVLATDNRQKAFIEVVKRAGLKIKVVEYLSTKMGEARIRALDILENEDNIDAIFTTNEITTLATILALRSTGKSGKIIHIGFDSHQLIIDSVRNLTLHGFILQEPFQMGYQGIYTLHKAMQGEKVSDKIMTNILYVDKNNINNADIKIALKAYQK